MKVIERTLNKKKRKIGICPNGKTGKKSWRKRTKKKVWKVNKKTKNGTIKTKRMNSKNVL